MLYDFGVVDFIGMMKNIYILRAQFYENIDRNVNDSVENFIPCSPCCA